MKFSIILNEEEVEGLKSEGRKSKIKRAGLSDLRLWTFDLLTFDLLTFDLETFDSRSNPALDFILCFHYIATLLDVNEKVYQ